MALLASGCGGVSPELWLRPDEGSLATPGVIIEGEERSFRIVAGRPFRTPFWSYDCPAAPTTRNHELAERLGAQRVRVTHPAVSEPLYGILAFCHVHPDVQGPTRRSYQLHVPDERVAQTEGGRVAFVAETTGHMRTYGDGAHNLPAWILWISRRPLSPE